MLTLILLVVLGGGVGILAVSMAERKPATGDAGTRRGTDAAADDGDRPEPPRNPSETASDPASSPTTAVERTPGPRPGPGPGPVARPERPRRIAGPARRRSRGDVPKSQTAVEGRLADLVRPSMPRRIASLVGVAVIVVAVGVGIATVLGAIVGAAAEILDNTIG